MGIVYALCEMVNIMQNLESKSRTVTSPALCLPDTSKVDGGLAILTLSSSSEARRYVRSGF